MVELRCTLFRRQLRVGQEKFDVADYLAEDWLEIPKRLLDDAEPKVQPIVDLLLDRAFSDEVDDVDRGGLLPDTIDASDALFNDVRVDERVRPGLYKLTPDNGTYTLTQGDEVVERGAVGDTVGRGAGFAWFPAWESLAQADPVEFTITTPYEAVRELATSLKVKLDPSGEFLTLQLSGSNPALTATTLNAVSRRAVAVAA